MLSPKQIAIELDISKSTTMRLIKSGEIPSIVIKSGKRKKLYRVREEALEKWIIGKERKGSRKAEIPNVSKANPFVEISSECSTNEIQPKM